MSILNKNYRKLYLLIIAIFPILNGTGKCESEIDSIISLIHNFSGGGKFNHCKQPDRTIAIRIGNDNCYYPHIQSEIKVPVSVKETNYGLWGFDFLIHFDTTVLIFERAEAGLDFYSDSGCNWEHFTYRYSGETDCGPIVCTPHQIGVSGICNVGNIAGIPNCSNPSKTGELFNLVFRFRESAGEFYGTSKIQFYWRRCRDNVFAFNYTANYFDYDEIFTASAAAAFDVNGQLLTFESFPTFGGISDYCIVDSIKQKRIINFYNGGIKFDPFCDPSDIGDVNLNGLAYEFADAVLFAKYFLHGLLAFTINQAGQIASTDLNQDGKALQLDDLVQFTRIATGDLTIDWIFDSSLGGVNTIQHDTQNKLIEYRAEQCSNIIWLKFEGQIDPKFDFHNGLILHDFDGTHTHVLALSLHGFNPPNIRLFSYSGTGKIVEAQAATFEGYDIPLTIPDFVTEINDEVYPLPISFQLHQNYPNPFNNSTVISFDIPRASNVGIEIINLLGQTVYRFEKRYSAGAHSISWDGVDNAGKTVGSGVYYYRIIAGDFIESKKMILLK